MSAPDAVLITTYYDDGHERRYNELSGCIEWNANRPEISQVVVLTEASAKKVAGWNSKIDARQVSARPLFSDFFAIANAEFPGRVCIIANTDIAFDGTLALVGTIDLFGKCLAISRRNARAPKRFYENQWCQDTWIFKSPIPELHAEFPIGAPSCDWRLARLLMDAGLQVLNPCCDVATWHHHRLNNLDRYPKGVDGPYAPVPPTYGLFQVGHTA